MSCVNDCLLELFNTVALLAQYFKSTETILHDVYACGIISIMCFQAQV